MKSKLKRILSRIWSVIIVGLVPMESGLADDYAKGLVKERISVRAVLPQMPSKTIINQEYRYPQNPPLLEAYIIEIPAGQSTSIHLHQVPLLAYVLSGELETNYGSKGIKTIRAGDMFVEAIEWCHFGKAAGSSPVRLLAMYLNELDSKRQKSIECKALQ